MNHIYKSVSVLSMLLCFGFVAKAQSTHTTTIEAYMRRMHELGLFNGNIMVVDGGKTVYKAAIGYADASKQVPLTTAYRFHIGSIAKEFDAVGIMLLQEQGKLTLDDKVSKFFPELPACAGRVSVKNLLQYTSGIPDVKWKTVHSDADNWKDLHNIQQLDFEPGSNYAYNNNNVFLRRRIIEKVTRTPFNAFVEQRLLKPASIKNGIVDPTEHDPLVALAFDDDFKPDNIKVPISGWTCLNLDDFYRWGDCINRFCLINPSSTRFIIIPVSPNKQCGLGGGTMKDNQVITHIHDGAALHYQALLATNAPKGRTVILLTNQRQDNVYDLNDAIQAILDNKPFTQPRKSIVRQYHKQLDSLNGVQALTLYHQLKAGHPQDYGFENENTLNELGYFFLNNKHVADAVMVFEYNIQLFPSSGNVYDSLGEAYDKQGNKVKALLNYKKAYQLDPDNQTAKEYIAEAKP